MNPPLETILEVGKNENSVLAVHGSFHWEYLNKFITDLHTCAVGTHRKFDLDLSELMFVKPVEVACLAAGLAYLKLKGFSLDKITRPSSADVERYLSRLHFYEDLNLPTTAQFSPFSSQGRFLELTRLTDAEQCQCVASKTVHIYQEKLQLSENTQNALSFVLAELAENIFHHAVSPTGGWICCQSYEDLISVIIVDIGVGIEHALSDNPSALAAIREHGGPLKAAISPKITGRPAFNSGLGLFWTSKLVEQNDGYLRIHSQRACLNQVGGIVDEIKTERWPGTVVYLTFKRNNSLDIASLFQQYAPEENDFEFLG